MNAPHPANRILSLRLIAGLAALLWSSGAPAQTPPPASPNTNTAERFLVVVETSAATQKRTENIHKLVGNLISSGLHGQMVGGSTIGLWTFNDKLHTGEFPLQLWTTASRQRVALTMVQFLQQQKFEKTPRLAVTWDAVTNIVAHSDHLTVLLISSGNDAVAGTPFDAAIAESFLKNAEAQRKQNMPFLTILRAAAGKFVSFAVNMPPWPLEVPEYPDGFKPVALAPPPKIETNVPPPVAAPRDPTVLSPTNTIYLTESAPPLAAPVTPAPRLEPTNPPVSRPTPERLAPAPAEVKPQPPAAAAETSLLTAVDSGSPAKTKFPVVTILVAGIALLLGIMVVFIALLRWSRRSTGASLITRSLDQDPK